MVLTELSESIDNLAMLINRADEPDLPQSYS
jgi:hypothetical protein